MRFLSILGVSLLTVFLSILASFDGISQASLTNSDMVKLVKAGLSEDIIIGMVNSQPGKYSLGADDVISLKKAGVSEKIIAAMMKRSKAGGDRLSVVESQSAPTTAGLPTEIGVYAKKKGEWIEVQPEVVNWKTGGVLKHIGSAGIVQGDVNGRINGPHSRNYLNSPAEFVIVTAEGIAITEYQLLRLREEKEAREFRSVTGGVLHASGGATRDLLPFEGKKLASRTFAIIQPNLTPGEYGFLPPGAFTAAHSSSSLGKMYTFRMGE